MENFEEYTITVAWEIADGYVGKSRPQKTVVKPYDDMDLEDWEKLTPDEKETYLDDAVQTDYESKISYDISDYGLCTDY